MQKSIGAYALAGVALGVAVLLRFILDPILGDAFPLVTLFGAIAAIIWLAGPVPAVLATFAGYIACALLFIPPRGVIGLDESNLVGMAAYVFTCSLIIAIGQAMRVARRRASERHQMLQVTLRSIGDAVITTDAAGRVQSMNPVAEGLTRWTQTDAAGVPLEKVFNIVHEETREPAANPAARAIREGIIVGLANHTILIGKDGSEHHIDDSAAPIRDSRGAITGCVLIFRDVSERRIVERERSNRLHTARVLAAIVEGSDDAIVSKALDGTIQSWNAGAERVFGYPAEQAIGRHISLVIPRERQAEEAEIVAKLKAGKRIEHFETERQRADGTRIKVSLTISPIRNEAGEVVGASKIARDITEQWESEQRERELHDHLRRLAADLADASRRKDEFLAMLAHELRNPLAPLSNAVHVLRLKGDDPAAVADATAMLQRQVGQLQRLVDDLLDVNRITQGRIELRRERVELAPIVHQAIEATKALYHSMEHELTVTLPTQPIVLDADPARLTQVIGNLLNNAYKFTPRGGRVRLAVVPDGAHVAIRVDDTGIGISPRDIGGIFELFTQIDTSLERSRDGLGIGLTLVRTLVEMHGGTVEAFSEGTGKGSQFVIRLPIAVETRQASHVEARDGATPGPSRRVLIVDDNADGASSLAMIVSLSGHEAFVAHDGETAIRDAERLRPDVVLLDIGLPRLNGYEACRRIRSSSWGARMHIVAVTGWGQEADREKSRAAGFNAHLVKPVNPRMLMTLLANGDSGGTAGR